MESYGTEVVTGLKSSLVSEREFICEAETCERIDDGQVSLGYNDQEAWSGDDYDGGEACPGFKQVGGDQDGKEIRDAGEVPGSVPSPLNETSMDTISSASLCPIMCPLEAFDLEIKYGVQVWEQMKMEAKQNHDHFQKVLGSISDLKESLAQFISEKLPLLKEPHCLQNHQNYFTAINFSKQMRFDSNPQKAGRKGQKTSLHMPTTPDKRTIEKVAGSEFNTSLQSQKTPKTTKTQNKPKNPPKKLAKAKKTNTEKKSNKLKNGHQSTVKTRRRLNLYLFSIFLKSSLLNLIQLSCLIFYFQK